MSTLHFVLGGGMTDAQWQALSAAVTQYYIAHIPNVQFNVICYHFTDDVHSMIKANQPTGPLVICGHSYGGNAAIDAAVKFAADGRTVDHLILFDPVSTAPNAYTVPNTTGFAVPSNVTEAVAFYRGATEAPYSGMITSGPNCRNVLFPTVGGGDASHHGDAVWDSSCYGYVAIALGGGHFLPVIAPPPAPVVPTPTPPLPITKKVTGFVINYSDGTSESHTVMQ